MDITLKRVLAFETPAEEGWCYTADLHVDGRRIGRIGNRGVGGSDEFCGDQTAFDKADRWCQDNLPPWKVCDALIVPTCLKIVCRDLVQDHAERTVLRRQMKACALLHLPGRTGLHRVKPRATTPTSPVFLAVLRKQYPDAVILNLLPLDEALGIYRAAVL